MIKQFFMLKLLT